MYIFDSADLTQKCRKNPAPPGKIEIEKELNGIWWSMRGSRSAVIENIDFRAKMSDKHAWFLVWFSGFAKKPLQAIVIIELAEVAVRKKAALKAD